MNNLRYLVWIVVPVAVYITYLAVGLPHFIGSYSWIDQGQGYNPLATRWYTRCTFIGPYGSFTTHPTNGNCGWVIFRKNPGGRASG